MLTYQVGIGKRLSSKPQVVDDVGLGFAAMDCDESFDVLRRILSDDSEPNEGLVNTGDYRMEKYASDEFNLKHCTISDVITPIE